MLYYLGIARMKGHLYERLEADYVLCVNTGKPPPGEFGLCRVGDYGTLYKPALVKSMADHEDMVEAMSYPFRIRFSNDTRRFILQGALMWYICNKYGERDYQQPPIFVKMVPDRPKKPRALNDTLRRHWILGQDFARRLADTPGTYTPDTFDVPKYYTQRFEREEKLRNERDEQRIRDFEQSQCERAHRDEEWLDLSELGVGLGEASGTVPELDL